MACQIPGLFARTPPPPPIESPTYVVPPQISVPVSYASEQGGSLKGTTVGLLVCAIAVSTLVMIGLCFRQSFSDRYAESKNTGAQSGYWSDDQDNEDATEIREARARAVRAAYEAHGTTTDYAKKFREGANNALKELNNDLFKIIEVAHGTVKCKRGTVTSCVVETVDGSDFIGPENSNVSKVRFAVTIVWDGQIHKDGYTVMEFDYDAQSDVMLSGKITKTNAMVNLLDPEWWKNTAEFLDSL